MLNVPFILQDPRGVLNRDPVAFRLRTVYIYCALRLAAASDFYVMSILPVSVADAAQPFVPRRTIVVAFHADQMVPIPLPDSKRGRFDGGDCPDERFRRQAAWAEEHIYPNGVPDRRRLLFSVVFVFPDDPSAMGLLDPHFTCRTRASMEHYIMNLYIWPESVKRMFPGGAVRFHSLCVLDHDNVVLTPALFDATLLSVERLAITPIRRVPITFTVLCYRFEMRQSQIAGRLRRKVNDKVETVSLPFFVVHQTFQQLVYGIHKKFDRQEAFFAKSDRVMITESLLDGTIHRVTAETYGTRVYLPDIPMEVDLRCDGL